MNETHLIITHTVSTTGTEIYIKDSKEKQGNRITVPYLI